MIEEFIEHLKLRGKESAANVYRTQLIKFEQFLASKGSSLDTFTPADVQEFTTGMKPRTANLTISAIRSYLAFRVSTASPENYMHEDQRYHAVKSLISLHKVPTKLKKSALKPEEVETLLTKVYDKYGEPLFSGVVCLFYFGWRAGEAVENFSKARISYKNRYIWIITAKTGNERIIPYPDYLHAHVKAWQREAKRICSTYVRHREYLTKHLRKWRIGGVRVTAKTARRTFETHMRKSGMTQWKLNFVLGHSTQVPDIYTDYTELVEDIRHELEEKHYLTQNMIEQVVL